MRELVLLKQAIMGTPLLPHPHKSQHRVSLSTTTSGKIIAADVIQHQVITDRTLSVVRLESPYKAVGRRISSFHIRCGC